MSEPVYELTGLVQRFGPDSALRVDRFTLDAGVIAGVHGPNGAGKSTLLSVLAFLAVPHEGGLRFLGRPAAFADPALRRQSVLLPQDPALLHRSVLANVSYGLTVRGVRDRQAALAALEMVGLAPESFARRPWWKLSGGEARRVALAARLALSPRGLLLDEPTASLDPPSAERVRQAVLAGRKRLHLACLAVSHDRAWLESFCDRLYRLDPSTGLTES